MDAIRHDGLGVVVRTSFKHPKMGVDSADHGHLIPGGKRCGWSTTPRSMGSGDTGSRAIPPLQPPPPPLGEEEDEGLVVAGGVLRAVPGGVPQDGPREAVNI